MIDNEITFGMDGMSLDGTYWHNPKTGDSFMIKNNYFEDNRMVIITSDNRRFDLDRMSDYVQTKSLVKKTQPSPQQIKEELPPEVASIIDTETQSNPISPIDSILIDPEDLAIINGVQNKQNQPLTQSVHASYTPTTNKTPNLDIIGRALSKSSIPDFHINMTWDNFPQREIEMLHDVMDIPLSEISEYYMDKISESFDDFLHDMMEQLTQYIKSKTSDINNTDEPPLKTTKKPSKKSCHK